MCLTLWYSIQSVTPTKDFRLSVFHIVVLDRLVIPTQDFSPSGGICGYRDTRCCSRHVLKLSS